MEWKCILHTHTYEWRRRYTRCFISKCFSCIIYIYTCIYYIINVLLIYIQREVYTVCIIIIYSVRRYTHFGLDPNFMSDTEEVCVDEMVSDPFHHMYVSTYRAISMSPSRLVLLFIFVFIVNNRSLKWKKHIKITWGLFSGDDFVYPKHTTCALYLYTLSKLRIISRKMHTYNNTQCTYSYAYKCV